MEIEINNKIYTREQIWLISIVFTVDPNHELFCLFISDEKDYPLIEEGKIQFFKRNRFIEMLGKIGFPLMNNQLEEELDFTYNIPVVIDIIRNGDIRKTALLLDSINILLDMINALNINIDPESERRILDFADHITFNADFVQYIERTNLSRDLILNTMYLLNGAVASNCKSGDIPLNF